MQVNKVYLHSEFELRNFIENQFFKFEGAQSTSRPFVWWTDEAVIYDMWIPFSKITFIGKESYKTYSKQELQALLSSSFQKFGKIWPYIQYAPLFLCLALSILFVMALGINILFKIFPECYGKFRLAEPFLFWPSFWFMSIVMPLSLVVRFYLDALIIRVPMESADKTAVAFYGSASDLHSALITTKKYPVYAGYFLADVFYGNAIIFFSLCIPRFVLIDQDVERLFAFVALVMIVYLMLEGSEYRLSSHFNIANTIDARIKNLERIIRFQEMENNNQKISKDPL